jgi:hypothetical protein
MFDNNCSKGIFPIPDVRGGHDTCCCDSKITLLTSGEPTMSPDGMGCKRQNTYLYQIHQQGRPEFKVYN